MSFRSISENLNAYREEAGSHPVALDRVLGFTFIRAWVYLMFVGAAASSMTWSGEQIPPLFYVVSTASLCAVLFGSALAGERFVRFMTHPAARFAAPALTTGGTLLLASSAAGTGAALSFGILGAITAPLMARLFRVRDGIAKGVAIGTCSHAVGTTKALEMGELEGAMSGVSIAVSGLLTTAIVIVASCFL